MRPVSKHGLGVWSVCALTLVISIVTAAGALGSFEGTVEVFQPVVVQEAIILSRVTYALHWGTYAPFLAISRTCSEHCMVTTRGNENRNLANRMGLSVSKISNLEHQDGLFGDTLRVALDTTELHADTVYTWFSPDTIVAATVECILGNAKRDSKVRYLDLQVVGRDEYQHLSNTWDLEASPARPRRRVFNN